MTHLFLDIETIPSERARERLWAGVKPPGTMTKPETIAKWEAECREEAEEAAFRRGSLDACFGEIICVGLAYDDDYPPGVAMLPDDNEKCVLMCVAASLKETLPPVTIVGHNALQFDVPWLWRRWIANGITPPEWWPTPTTAPWQSNVYDTSAEWAGHRNRVGLDDLCFALGIDSPKGDVDGSQVYDLWKARQHDKIAEYCRADVKAVREVYKKMTGRTE